MPKSLFSELSGFDPEILRGLKRESLQFLEITSLWCLISIFLVSISTSLIFYYCFKTITPALLVFVGIFLILLALQFFLINGTIGNVSLTEKEFKKRSLSLSNILFFLFIAVIFSQPIMNFLSSKIYSNEIHSYLLQKDSIERSFYKKKYAKKQDDMKLDLATYSEYLKQLGLNEQLPVFKKTDNKELPFASNTRKAIVIGNQHYPNSPLNNPVSDALSMQEKLKNIGFSVELIVDGDLVTIEKKLDTYYKLLKPGDISLVYFSGHGFQEHGNNYLVPIDFKSNFDRSNAISLNVIIESISHHSPLANVLIIDACRSSPGLSGLGRAEGLASIEAGLNTYVALPTEPGKYAIDGPKNSHGLFTQAILENLSNEEDIDTIFRKVREDVLQLSKNKQLTWTSHNLNGTVILSSPKTNKSNSIRELNVIDSTGITCKEFDPDNYTLIDRQNLQQCLYARYLKLSDDLLHVQENIVGLNNNKYSDKNKINDDILITKYKFIKHPIVYIFGSLLIIFLITGGFLVRHTQSKSFFDYEALFHQAQRNITLMRSKKFMKRAIQLRNANQFFSENAFSINTPTEELKIKETVFGIDAIKKVLKSI